jgi:hypothetical protein
VSMVKSCLWLGNASPPSQTCTHHGGKTDTDEYEYEYEYEYV